MPDAGACRCPAGMHEYRAERVMLRESAADADCISQDIGPPVEQPPAANVDSNNLSRG